MRAMKGKKKKKSLDLNSQTSVKNYILRYIQAKLGFTPTKKAFTLKNSTVMTTKYMKLKKT